MRTYNISGRTHNKQCLKHWSEICMGSGSQEQTF